MVRFVNEAGRLLPSELLLCVAHTRLVRMIRRLLDAVVVIFIERLIIISNIVKVLLHLLVVVVSHQVIAEQQRDLRENRVIRESESNMAALADPTPVQVIMHLRVLVATLEQVHRLLPVELDEAVQDHRTGVNDYQVECIVSREQAVGDD